MNAYALRQEPKNKYAKVKSTAVAAVDCADIFFYFDTYVIGLEGA